MSFVARNIPRLLLLNASRGSGHCRAVTPRIATFGHRTWRPQSITISHQSKRYNSGGANGPNWAGLVYAFMDNLQGKVKLGPACFVRDENSDEENSKRDMREEVPLRINRPWLRITAEAIEIRLQHLASDIDDTDEYHDLVRLAKLLERLADKDSDDPLLEFDEYKDIWDTVRAANISEGEFRLPIFSVTEKSEIARIYAIAGALYRTAALNAALQGYKGERLDLDDATDNRDYKSVALNIYGGLLDGKDYFGNNKWFTKEEDIEMLKAINQLRAESRKRGSDWG